MHRNLLLGGFALILVLGIGIYLIQTNNYPTDTAPVVNPMIVTSGENPEPGSIHDMPVEPAAAEARKDIATKLSVDEKAS